MKKPALLILLIVNFIQAQNLSLNDRLGNLCRFWGYVKYFHSKVSNCQLNWDSVLLASLADVRSATTIVSYNSALQSMLNAAGPMQVPTTAAYTIPPGYNTNLNLT